MAIQEITRANVGSDNHCHDQIIVGQPLHFGVVPACLEEGVHGGPRLPVVLGDGDTHPFQAVVVSSISPVYKVLR